MEHTIDQTMLEQFRCTMIEDEKSEATISKYLRDLKAFMEWMGEETSVCKETVIRYKEYLTRKYAVTSVNSMLAAVNSFFKRMEWYDCLVKALKVQREAFRKHDRELSKKEYLRLLDAARKNGNERLYLVMESICSTGIRISELKFITVESLSSAQVRVSLKGKTRTVLMPAKLCRKLRRYATAQKIKTGSIFITKSGSPLDRSNVLHDMKKLCSDAGVDRAKVFPHNLRHLFACTYYRVNKDLSHLADMLGHSNINTTRVYTQVSGEEQAKELELLGLVL